MMKGQKLGLLATSAIYALVPGQVNAQTSNSVEAGAPESASASGRGIDEIIVTAQRREESVQRSSVAISVLGGEDLERAGISTAYDLNSQVPGLTVAGGNTAQTFIRGVGDFGSSALGQSAVAYNLDGVYLADGASVFTHFYDIERVEVLKGPQGTLYGRNASGGAINLITRNPKLGEIGANLLAEVGNYDLIHVSGGLSVPLGDSVAVRGAFNVVDRDGYLADGTNDDVQQAGRLSVLFDGGGPLRVTVKGDYEHRGGRGTGSDPFPRASGSEKFAGAISADAVAQLYANAVVPGFLLLPPGSGLPPVAGGTLLEDTFVDHEQWGVMAEIDYELGDGLVATIIPAYRSSTNDAGSYVPGVPFLVQETSKQTSVEARLAYDNEWINAVVGGYFMDLDQETASQAYLLAVQTSFGDNDLTSRNFALFGQATFHLTPELRLVAGGRYSWENRTIEGSRQAVPAAPVPYAGEADFRNFSYRAGLEYDVGPHSMLYATTSRGFKSGGFNTFAPTAGQSNVYDPEVLYAYTLGIRNRFWDNRIQFNVEGFYWDYQDGHTTQFGYDPVGDLQFLTFNAGAAEIYGVEADFAVNIIEGGTFSANVAYLHAEYTDFTYEIPTPRYNPAANGCPAAVGGSFVTLNCTGFTLPRAPKWSGSINYEQEIALANGGSIVAGGGIKFASSRELSTDYVSVSRDKGYVLGDAFLTYNFPGDTFSLTAFAQNIGNVEYAVGGILHPFAPAILYPNVGAPRTYGLRLTVDY